MLEETATPKPKTTAPRKRRRVVRWLWRIAMAAVTIPIILTIVMALMLYNREVTAPSWVQARIEQEAAAVLGGGSVKLGRISVTVQEDFHPIVRMNNIVLRDAEDRVLARVPRVEAQVSPRGLAFRRELLVQDLLISGAQFNVRRSADGSVAITFEAGETTREAVNFLALLDSFDEAFERPALEALRGVRAEGLIVNFEDARVGRSWIVDGGELALDLRGQVVSLRGNAGLLSGRSEVTTVLMNYESLRNSRKAVMSVTVQDAYATDIASQAPALNWLSVLDAPMSAALRASTNETGDIESLHASLAIDEGSIRPNPNADPVPFERLSTYLTYHPGDQRISFDRVSARTAWGQFDAEGQAYLREFSGEFPQALVSQLSLTNVILDPAGYYDAPQRVDQASVDFRMRLSPFEVDVGQFYARTGEDEVHGTAQVRVEDNGWSVDLDATSDRISPENLAAFWPNTVKPGTRLWILNNLSGGYAFDGGLALRIRPERKPDLGISWQFADMSIRYLRDFPPITGAFGFAEMARGNFTAVLNGGKVVAPQGGEIDAAGSVFHIGNLGQKPAIAEIDLDLESTITASLSLLDLPPFQFLTRANRDVTLADGTAATQVSLVLPLQKGLTLNEVDVSYHSDLSNLKSDVIVEGHRLSAAAMTVDGTRAGLEISGDVRIGEVPASVTWVKGFDLENAKRSTLSGTVELSQRTLDQFRIALPPEMVSGRGTAEIDIQLEAEKAPELTLRSDLSGVSLSIPALGWSKAASQTGSFRLAATLGKPANVESISLNAPGLEAAGRIMLDQNGAFERARFDTLRTGGWLDASVELVSRGAGRPVAVEVRGGTLDIRNAKTGGGSGNGSAPLNVALDRLVISESIALTNFLGDFSSSGGLNGSFTALINDGAQVAGTLAPQNGGTAVRLRSANAGRFLASAGLTKETEGGALDLMLTPKGPRGEYDGELRITDIRVRKVPTIAELLNAVSVVGLLQGIDGPGIVFDDIQARFHLSPDQIIVTQGAATGASMGISVDGTYGIKTNALNLQGVVSPVYLINGIGAALTRPGEGLIGFNYFLGGTTSQPQVSVNPLSVLAPGMLRNIFRRETTTNQ